MSFVDVVVAAVADGHQVGQAGPSMDPPFPLVSRSPETNYQGVAKRGPAIEDGAP